MPSRRTPSRAIAAPAALAAGAALGVALLYLAAVRTAHGQRLDEAARGNLGADDGTGAYRATSDLLDTISVSSLVLLGAGVMAIALLRRRPRLAFGAGAVVLGANLTTQVLKARLERPELAGGVDPASFPSGHVTVAMSLAMALLLVAPPALRWGAALVGCAYAAGVGVAVIALDWHRPSDVIGGYLVAVAWTALAAAVLASGAGGRELGAGRRPPSPAARTAGAAIVVAGIGLAAVAARSVPDRLDLVTLADDRTAFAAAAVVCALACAALCVAVAALLQRTTASRRRAAAR